MEQIDILTELTEVNKERLDNIFKIIDLQQKQAELFEEQIRALHGGIDSLTSAVNALAQGRIPCK